MNNLQLITGTDIPFPEGTCTIHQPTLGEIAYIGEDTLFTGCGVLKFNKENLNPEDKINLANLSDFNIVMSIMNDKSVQLQNNIQCVIKLLYLMFPLYDVIIAPDAIVFQQENQQIGSINDSNYLAFKNILLTIFCLGGANGKDSYNVQGEMAKKIAEQLNRYHNKLAQMRPSSDKVSIFEKYISILAVGEHKDINSFKNYTVYQLFDEFQRFQLKEQYELYVKKALAGAQNLTPPESWMKDLHEDN